MAIKVTLGATENTQQEKPFPKLMCCKEGRRIVFATGERNGTDYEVLRITGFKDTSVNMTMTDRFGLFSEGNEFIDYNEPITIQNQ
jgi:hypothetical protein